MSLPARRRPVLPDHAFAIDHKVLSALPQYRTKARLRAAKDKRSCAEVAAERIREFCWDLGADKGWHRWIATSARQMGLSYTTAWAIARGKKTRVGPDVVDQISAATGVPVAVFYDEEI
jgi:hypothetical protein